MKIDEEVSHIYGCISFFDNMPSADALIAVSATVHQHVRDFKNVPGLEIINPWEFYE
jgi:hypothetical protein